MRTEGEPLLAAYVWRAGDLTAKSRLTLGSTGWVAEARAHSPGAAVLDSRVRGNDRTPVSACSPASAMVRMIQSVREANGHGRRGNDLRPGQRRCRRGRRRGPARPAGEAQRARSGHVRRPDRGGRAAQPRQGPARRRPPRRGARLLSRARHGQFRGNCVGAARRRAERYSHAHPWPRQYVAAGGGGLARPAGSGDRGDPRRRVRRRLPDRARRGRPLCRARREALDSRDQMGPRAGHGRHCADARTRARRRDPRARLHRAAVFRRGSRWLTASPPPSTPTRSPRRARLRARSPRAAPTRCGR